MHKDVLIVGQGIAGSMLGWHASEQHLSFDIYDPGSDLSASAVSSGIINPITGPKFVKSWMIDSLLPYAKKTYFRIQEELEVQVVKEIELWRQIPHTQAENFWDARMLDPNYQHYLSRPSSTDEENPFQTAHQFGIVHRGLLIDVPKLLESLREKWRGTGSYHEITFDDDRLEYDGHKYNYSQHSYDHVILAKGHLGTKDKWFATEDYAPVKGEVLICRIDNLKTQKVFKFGKFLVPLSSGLYWVGSNYAHHYDNAQPDVTKIRDLIHFLENDLRLPYEIIKHHSGVRPSTKFRRPFIGQHNFRPNLYLFNGLGTKGISLAPYFSSSLIGSITSKLPFQPTEAFIKCFGIPASR